MCLDDGRRQTKLQPQEANYLLRLLSTNLSMFIFVNEVWECGMADTQCGVAVETGRGRVSLREHRPALTNKVFGDIGHAQERISARVGMGYWER